MQDYLFSLRNSEILTFAQGDVTGDGVLDSVFITGYKEEEFSIARDITLVIQDGMTGQYNQIPLKENVGFDPALFLGDFTGDGVDDIYIDIPTGGSGGTTINYIYSYINNQPILLFDYEAYNEAFQYEVDFKDGYKVEVISELNDTKYLIDLSNRPTDYLNEIYDENGVLKEPISGWVDPISALYPIGYNSRNQIYLLLAYQQIAGRFHADSLGYVINRLKWDGQRFVLDNQMVGIFGSEI